MTMADENPNTKHLSCIVGGCARKFSAPTEEEILKQVAAHATHDHGMAEVSAELAAKVKAAITTQ